MINPSHCTAFRFYYLMFLQELRTLRFLRHFVQLHPTLHMLTAPICGRFVSASGALLLADVELPEPIAR